MSAHYQYPHMCQADHQRIGHSDSETETCPLCEALARLRAIEARYESDIEEALWFGIDYRDGGGFKDDVLAAWNERAEIGRK